MVETLSIKDGCGVTHEKCWSRVGLTVWSPHEATPDKVK